MSRDKFIARWGKYIAAYASQRSLEEFQKDLDALLEKKALSMFKAGSDWGSDPHWS